MGRGGGTEGGGCGGKKSGMHINRAGEMGDDGEMWQAKGKRDGTQVRRRAVKSGDN